MHYKLISDLHSGCAANLQDRAIHYGDGLFETMRVDNGSIPYWDLHYHRLAQSAVRLGISCPLKTDLEKDLEPYLAQQKKQLVIKLILSRGEGGRGLQLPDSLLPNVYLLGYDLPNDTINQPIDVTISEIRLPINPRLAGIKHLNRLDYVLATQKLNKMPQFAEAILLDQQGQLVESIVHNIFFIKDHQFYTPELRNAGVDGIKRQIILNHLKNNAKKVTIGEFGIDELLDADECFLCNSVQGIRPVTRVENINKNIGPLTRKLQQDLYGSTFD